MVPRKSAKVGHPVPPAKGQLSEEEQRLLDGCASARTGRPFEASQRPREQQCERHLVTGSTLRALLDISAPTLWRWRQTPGFPQAWSFNNRIYFVWAEILCWLDDQAGQSNGSSK
jgi:predicted DNA-binding transcriptional regulator AlpA